jgi:NAD(P)-dependent dehydrogenase (short-subunit alcohol dehydrogenase family)
MSNSINYLVIGATGSIGSACAEMLQKKGNVIRGSRDLLEFKIQVKKVSGFDGIVWAQGINAADSIEKFEIENYEKIMDANITYMLNSLKILLDDGKVNQDAQLVVLSSIWSQTSRPNKLSYGISKAALSGLVRSLSVDLGPLGIHVNSVLPGPIDTPMTIKNLKPQELARVISETPIKRLVSLDEVVSVVCGIVTGKLRGVTGQEIVIDGGWSVSKLV